MQVTGCSDANVFLRFYFPNEALLFYSQIASDSKVIVINLSAHLLDRKDCDTKVVLWTYINVTPGVIFEYGVIFPIFKLIVASLVWNVR